MRKTALALALALSLIGPALAQAPGPVPALPDTERRTTYALNASTCASSVGFALYGDSTDVDQWVQVWINGTRYLSNDATYGWSLSSASGSLATLARPISNAVLTFNSAVTGTVQIVGARRARRTNQFSENRGVAARDLNQIITDIVATLRENWDRWSRAIQAPPGETLNVLATSSARASKFFVFDGDGQPSLTAVTLGTGNVIGPGSSTNGGFVKWSGTSGTQIANSPALIQSTDLSPSSVTGGVGNALAANTVANSNLATVSAFTFKGNNTGSTATPVDMTGPQAVTILSATQTVAEAAVSTTTLNTPATTFAELMAMQPVRNIVGRNGGLEVWQRGAGINANIAVVASTSQYTADGWYVLTNANQAMQVSAQPGITAGSRFSARVQRNSGQTGTGNILFSFPLDADEVARLNGVNAVFSFAVSTGANFQGSLNYTIFLGTGAAARRGNIAYTGETSPISGAVPVTSAYAATRIVSAVSSTLPSTTSQAEIQFSWTPIGTAGSADYFQIDDVQIEVVPASVSSFRTTFERTPFLSDLQRSQRHYVKTFPYNTAPAQNAGVAGSFEMLAQAAVTQGYMWKFPVQMRTSPTITSYNPSAANANCRDTSGSDNTVTVDPSSIKTADGVFIQCGAAAAAGRIILIHADADASLPP